MTRLPNYDEWSRDQLISRLLELEAKCHASQAEDVISRLPMNVGPRMNVLLRLLIEAWPHYVPTEDFLSAGAAKNSSSLKVLICHLRTKLHPHVQIETRYGQGYRLKQMKEFLALADAENTVQLVNNPRTHGGDRPVYSRPLGAPTEGRKSDV